MKNMSSPSEVQSWINQIKNYQEKAPDLFDEDNQNLDSDFEINHYFDILDKVKVEKGWLVDYLYLQEWLGGEPKVIAYPEFKKEKYKDMINKINTGDLDHVSEINDSKNIIENFLNSDDLDSYLKHLKLDKSKDSYLQFVILAELGSQFSLFWHALYNDHHFASTLKAAEKIVEEINDGDYFPIGDSFNEELKNMDFKPQIIIKEEKVVVRMVYFTKWGGFIEGKYRVKKTFPHRIIATETKELLYYNCGHTY